MDIPHITGFVIYNPVTQKFSTGSTNPHWNRSGKIWSAISNVKKHLQQFIHVNAWKKEVWISDFYKDCVIVNIKDYSVVDLDIYEYLENCLSKDVVNFHNITNFTYIGRRPEV